MAKILMVVTSHSKLGKTDKETGFWWEELAAPYLLFKEYGFDVDIASPKGGTPPADPLSNVDKLTDEFVIATVRQFQNDGEAMSDLNNSMKLDDVDASEYDAVFFVGGHGAMWDFPNNPVIHDIIRTIDEEKGIIAAVCHGPAAFIGAHDAEGDLLVHGCKVTGFSDMEETLRGTEDIVPFMLEDELIDMGADYVATEPWQPLAIYFDRLVTGENPASSTPLAQKVVNAVREWRGEDGKKSHLA